MSSCSGDAFRLTTTGCRAASQGSRIGVRLQRAVSKCEGERWKSCLRHWQGDGCIIAYRTAEGQPLSEAAAPAALYWVIDLSLLSRFAVFSFSELRLAKVEVGGATLPWALEITARRRPALVRARNHLSSRSPPCPQTIVRPLFVVLRSPSRRRGRRRASFARLCTLSRRQFLHFAFLQHTVCRFMTARWASGSMPLLMRKIRLPKVATWSVAGLYQLVTSSISHFGPSRSGQPFDFELEALRPLEIRDRNHAGQSARQAPRRSSQDLRSS